MWCSTSTSVGVMSLTPAARHAADHPAVEGVAGDDQAELELGQFGGFLRDEVRGGDDALRRLFGAAVSGGRSLGAIGGSLAC
jgi:hypothetical protein